MKPNKDILEKFDKEFGTKDVLPNTYRSRAIKSFISKALDQAREEERKATRKIITLYGEPICENLHHSKKHRHSSSEECPVEKEIINFFNKQEDKIR